jgi:hypothetical protein
LPPGGNGSYILGGQGTPAASPQGTAAPPSPQGTAAAPAAPPGSYILAGQAAPAPGTGAHIIAGPGRPVPSYPRPRGVFVRRP